jgi:DNA/RNA endonuclease G (NUC1)
MNSRTRFLGLALFLSSALAALATISTSLQDQLGNPSSATADPTNHNHYLIRRAQYALDYSDNNGDPNWVSWNLTSGDVGSSGRSSFIPDPDLPSGFYALVTGDYTGSGYDRGHMCPSADRTITTTDNQIVFYMSNIIPQTADNNQGPWASFETYCRTLASAGNELLIISGPSGFAGSRIPSGKAAIPGYTWKIVLVVPVGAGTALSRIDVNTRVIAIKVPNISGIRSNPWQNYIVSAATVETDTGFDFFRSVEATSVSLANTLRAKIDGQTATGAPTITAQPTAQTTAVGGSATFSVTATGDAPLSYQWAKDDVDIAEATNASLTLANVQAGDAGNYTVEVTNNVGTVTSNAAALVITGLPPSITTQPASRAASAGTSATFSVSTSGTPPFSYRWRKGTTNLSNGGNIAGATSATLVLSNVQSADAAADYNVVVTNTVSAATSNNATLTVTPAAPTITASPATQTITTGSTATLTVTAIGTAPLSYQWRKGGTPLADGGAISGASTATLTIANAQTTDSGSYDVIVSNGINPSATSTAATLTVSASSASSTVVWNFGAGAGTETAVPTSGLPSDVTGGTLTQNNNNGTTTMITAVSVSSGYTGASGGNNAGAAARTGALNIGASGSAYFEFTLTPAAGKQLFVTAISFGSRSTSTGPQAYDIYTSLDNYTARIATGTLSNNSTYVLQSPTISALTSSPGAGITFRLFAYNGAGSASANTANWRVDDLKVVLNTVAAAPTVPAVASTSPANGATNVAINSAIAITFNQAVNVGNAWFAINSAANGLMAATVTGGPATYTLTPPNNFDNGDTITVTLASVQITDQATGALHPTSNFSFAFTTITPTAPSITTSPVAQTVAAGSDVTFSVVATGTAPLSYQWRKAGTPISGNASANTAILTLTNVQAADATTYDVVVSNGVNPSATSTTAALTVNPAAPTISTQPAAQVVTAGSTATFTVVATGTTPLTYSWRKGGVPLVNGTGGVSGATTATLTIAGTTTASSGNYDVVISNGVGSPVTSASASLTVSAAPTAFTFGDVLVVRVGTGTGSLVNTGNAVFLDEYSPAGTLVQSIPLPTAASGNNKPLILGGTSTTEGGLSRATEGRYAILTGYAATPGGATSLSSTTAATINRVIARIDASGNIDTTTALSDYASSSSPRSGATTDGSAFWIVGGAGGVRYAPLGATTSTSISSTIDNLRIAEICSSQLYVSTQSGSAVRIGSVGTGLPTTSGQTTTNLPGIPTTITPNAFFFGDLDATVAGLDTLYVADESGVIRKYALVAGTWTDRGSVTAAGVRGLTGVIESDKVTLFGTTGSSAATGGGTLYKFVDTTLYSGTMSGAANAIATAAANTAFRGVSITPASAPGFKTQPAPQTVVSGGTAVLAVTTDGSLPQTFRWRRNGVDLVNGGVVSGADTATLTLTGVTSSNAGNYDVVVANPANSTGVASNTATLTISKATATVALGNLAATYSGSPIAATATTTPAGLPVVITYAGSSTAPTNAGSYSVVATINHPDYAGTASGMLVIGKAAASVTLGSLSATYTGSAQTAIATTAPSGLTVAFTYDGSATAPSNAGNYAVVGTINDPNYAGSASGTLVIGPATATVTLGNLSQTYNGSAHVATATTVPSGLAVTFTYNGAATAPIDPGTYAVVASVSDTNYIGTTSGTLVVGKATATITFSNLTQTYDGNTHSVAVSSTPPVASISVIYNGLSVPPTNAGTYGVIASITDPHYVGSASNTLIIAKATQTVQFGSLPASPTVGTAFTVSATASSALPVTFSIASGNATVSGNSVTINDTSPVVLRATQAGDTNYNSASVDTTLTATAAPKQDQTITFAALVSKTTTAAPFALSATASSGLAVTFEIVRGPATLSGNTVTLAGTPGLVVVRAMQSGSAAFNAAPPVERSFTVTPRPAFAGIYFGTLGNGGSFALYVREDRTGVFLAFDPTSRAAFVSRTFTVDENGRFRFTTAAPAEANNGNDGPPRAAAEAVVDGTIGADGTVAGSVAGIPLTGTKSAGSGPAASLGGFFTASAAGNSAEMFTIVDVSGQALVVIQNGGNIDGGSGRVDEAGNLTAATSGSQFLNGTVSANGTMEVVVSNLARQRTTFAGLAEASTARAAQRLLNLSTRARAGTIADAAIAGFVIAGDQPKEVLIRAVGPTLGSLGVGGALAAPKLDLIRNGTVLGTNTGWTSSGDSAALAAAATRAGAFALGATSADSALLLTLAPGNYSAIVTAANNQPGVGLIEVYDLSEAAVGQKLLNISTRAAAGTGADALIAGVVIGGTVPKRVLIRAAGPALAPFGVSGVLARPQLTLFSGSTVVAQNTGWSTSAEAATIVEAAAQAGAFAFATTSADCAIVINLAPGNYTAQVTGVANTTGVALVEIYELP